MRSELEIRISEEERKHAKKSMKKLAKEKLQSGDVTILKEVYEQLTYRGISENAMDHQINDRFDVLRIRLGEDTFQIIKSFTKQHKLAKHMTFSVKDTYVECDIPISTTPESFADFIMAVRDYMPEYRKIKEVVTVDEEQKKLARKLAADLVSKNICSKLGSKGYSNDFQWSENHDNAEIRVAISKGFSISLDINLSERFFQVVTKFVDSLPEMPETQEFSLMNLPNILFCTVIRNYDEALLQHLRNGGYNALVNNDELWVPNMSWSKAGIDKDYEIKVYRKKNELPGNAPMKRLKAINDKLEEYMEGFDNEERNEFLEMLITGVGQAAYYNRHRYKMPESILEIKEE